MGFFKKSHWKRAGRALRDSGRRVSRGFRKHQGKIDKSIKKQLKARYKSADISPNVRQKMLNDITNETMRELEPQLQKDPTGETREILKADIYREATKLADAREAHLIIHPKIPVILQVILIIGVPAIVFGIFLSLAYVMPGAVPPGDIIFPHMVTPPTGGPAVFEPVNVLYQGIVNGALYGGATEGIALLAWKILQ